MRRKYSYFTVLVCYFYGAGILSPYLIHVSRPSSPNYCTDTAITKIQALPFRSATVV